MQVLPGVEIDAVGDGGIALPSATISMGGTLPVPNWSSLNEIPCEGAVQHEIRWVNIEGDGFGQVLASFMRAMNYKQDDIASRTGIAQSVIGRILKSSQPTAFTIQKIAIGLGIDIEFLPNGKVAIHRRDARSFPVYKQEEQKPIASEDATALEIEYLADNQIAEMFPPKRETLHEYILRNEGQYPEEAKLVRMIEGLREPRKDAIDDHA